MNFEEKFKEEISKPPLSLPLKICDGVGDFLSYEEQENYLIKLCKMLSDPLYFHFQYKLEEINDRIKFDMGVTKIIKRNIDNIEKDFKENFKYHKDEYHRRLDRRIRRYRL